MPFLLALPFLAAVAVGALVVGGAVLLMAAFKPKTPAISAAAAGRLNKSMNPDEPRKAVLGNTCFNADMRYWEVYGSTGYDEIIACATHKVTSFGAYYINGDLVSFSGANATGTWAGLLTKNNVTEGVTATTVSGGAGAGSLWTSAASFTGCAYYRLKYTYDQKKMTSGFPSRITQVGEGAPVYDPRKDSTNGGSGSHRFATQSTWDYAALDSNSVPIGRNNALQMLWYEIGWRITSPQTGVADLVFGRGVDFNDFDWPSWIAAANDAETEQYYTDCVLSSGDSHSTNESVISAGSTIGVLLDTGGQWSYHISTNDTAAVAVALDDNDIVSAVSWTPRAPISEQYNEIEGTFIDPTTPTLYQAAPWPIIRNATYLAEDNAIPHRMTLDFQSVQSAALAQKLARIALNKTRITGQLKATFSWKALKAQNYNIVTLTFGPLGFVNKIFRVMSMVLNPMGGVDLVLQEEAAAVYTGGTITGYTTPSVGAAYDVTQAIALAGLTATAQDVTGDATHHYDGLLVSWTTVAANVRRVEVQIRKTGTTNWLDAGVQSDPAASAVEIYPLLAATGYDIRARTISVNDVPGAWASTTGTTSAYTTFTQNQTYNQTTDPALSATINDGAFWGDTTLSKLKMRLGGSWQIVADLTTTLTAGTVLFDSTTPGTTAVPIPSNSTAHVTCIAIGGGGGAGGTHGGGGAEGRKLTSYTVTPGSTTLNVTVGTYGISRDLGIPAVATDGGSSIVKDGVTTILSAAGGGNGQTVAGAAGTGGSGGSGTAGEAGDTGGSGNGGACLFTDALVTGGARQTASGGAGNDPGGGANHNTIGTRAGFARVIIVVA